MVKWNNMKNMKPPVNKTVVVRVEDDGPHYFEDRMNGEGFWAKAMDGHVTHWAHRPQLACPMCGRKNG